MIHIQTNTTAPDPREELYAVVPHVRICAGGWRVTAIPTVTAFLLFSCIIHPWHVNHEILNRDIAPLGRAGRRLLKKALENEEVNTRVNELRQELLK